MSICIFVYYSSDGWNSTIWAVVLEWTKGETGLNRAAGWICIKTYPWTLVYTFTSHVLILKWHFFFPFFWYKCYFFYFESWNPFILNGHSTRHVFPKATVCFLLLSNCFPQSIADMDCEIVTINLVRQMLFLLLLQNSIHHSLCCFISNNILPLELQEVTPNPTVSAMLAGKRHICTWICTIEY